jgi:hypothetical protein
MEREGVEHGGRELLEEGLGGGQRGLEGRQELVLLAEGTGALGG